VLPNEHSGRSAERRRRSIRAERHYRQAIAVAERQSAKLYQLRASVSLARLWRDQGKHAEARDLLGPIYRWFTEDFDAPDMKDAKALLDEFGVSTTRHPTGG
jgi:predicted ATPase